jgi:hypothetical protein
MTPLEVWLMKKKFGIPLLTVVILLCTAPVLADGDIYVVMGGGGVGTKISSLPYEIKTAGFYYVTGNLFYNNGDGITVTVDDVTIDFMGFRLSGPGVYSGIAIGSHKNVEVRNGSLGGWGFGIYAGSFSSANNRIINIRAEGNIYGIYLKGFSHLVKGCTTSDNNWYGIYLDGAATISGNVINHNGTYGIYATGGYAQISGNMVSNADTHIYLNGPGSIIGNTVKTDSSQLGIDLRDISSTTAVLVDQNIVGGPGAHAAWASSSQLVFGTNAGFGF